MNKNARICYWMFNYAPRWEAVSKEVKLLSETFQDRFGTRIISLDFRTEKTSFLGRDKHLPLPLGIIGLPLLIRSAKATPVNHVFASPGGTFLTRLLASRSKHTVLTISKDSTDLNELEKNADVLKALRCVVVESERHKDLLLQLGLRRDHVELIYPGVDLDPTRPAEGPFTILFATAPLGKYGLLSRGVYLTIQVAKLLPDVRFRFVWRAYPETVKELVRQAGVANIEIIEGFVPDMGAMYDSAHATILPGLTETSLKPCPHSGLESLARGKPVLVSRPTSFSSIVEQKQCGVVFDATIPSLCTAIQRLRERYGHFQANSQTTSQAHFSKNTFVERYADLYTSLLDEPL